MPKFRKKPVVIEAVQQSEFGKVYDKSHDTWIPYEVGDWVITGVKGETYPCKNVVFVATYDPVEDNNA